MTVTDCQCHRCVYRPDWENHAATSMATWAIYCTALAAWLPVAALAWTFAFVAVLGWVGLATDVSAKWDHEDRREYERRQGLWDWFDEDYGEVGERL